MHPFHRATENAPTTQEKALDLVDEVLSVLGPRDVARILLDGEPEAGVEPVTSDTVRGALSLDDENGITRVTIENVATGDDEAYEGLRRLVLSWYDLALQNKRTNGPPRYHRTIEYEIEDLPMWLQAEVLRAEMDRTIGQLVYDHPDDYARELVLLQLAAEKFGAENERDRRQAWDEMLKFTKYKVRIEYALYERGNRDGDPLKASSRERIMWHQSSTKAHNWVLRRLREEENAKLDDDEAGYWLDAENIEVIPRQRYAPGFDPLPDLEDFVWRL